LSLKNKPVVAFGLPLLDAVLAFFRRSLKGKPFYKGDREHIHHKLTDDLGLSQKTTVLILYTASIILGVMSIIMARNGMQNIIVLLISMAVVLIAVIAFIYKPPQFIVGKQNSKSDSMSKDVRETADEE